MPRTFPETTAVELCEIKHDDGTPEIAVAIGGNFIARDLVAVEHYWRFRSELRQCHTELEEAAKLLAEHFPSTASIYRMAATRVAASLKD